MSNFSTDAALSAVMKEHQGRRKSTSAAIGDALLAAHNERLERQPERLIKRPLFLRQMPQRPDEAIVPLLRPKEPYSDAQIEAWFSGVLPRLDGFDQSCLREYRTACRELERAEAEAETISAKDEPARERARQKREAFWTSERDYERSRWELYMKAGGRWAGWERECAWLERWNDLVRDDTVEIGVRSVTNDELAEIVKAWHAHPYETWLDGCEQNDLAKKAWVFDLDRRKCELAKKQRAAGIPLDLDG